MAGLERIFLAYIILIISLEIRHSSGFDSELRCKRSNGTVIFRCSMAGTQVKEVRWRRSGLSGLEWLEDKGNLRVYIMSDELVIRGLRPNDSAIYEAWAMGDRPKRLCRWSLWVTPGGICRTFPRLRGKKKIVAKAGQKVCFSSQLEVPKPPFVPFDLKMLILHFNVTSPGPQPNMVKSDRLEGVRSLNMCIHNLTVYDSGLYRQNAIGSTGTAGRRIRLIVKERARIIQPPQSADVLLSERVTLTCVARGNPVPSITWYKDGTRLGRLHSNHARHVVKGNRSMTMTYQASQVRYQSSSQLIIHPMSTTSAGRYRCLARNKGQFGGSDMQEADVLLLKRFQTGFLEERVVSPMSSHINT